MGFYYTVQRLGTVMKTISRLRLPVLLAFISYGNLLGCEEDGWKSMDTPAQNFALVDQNPASPTFQEVRQIAAAKGAVLIIYFADYA